MEHDREPVRGLPARLPPGEHILWQGAPDWRVLARSAFHTRWIAAYFVALALYGLSRGSLFGAGATAAAGMACLALLHLFAWASARTTVYTLTNKRIVLRIGVALSVSFNLPLKTLAAADLRPLDRGHGDIALRLTSARIGWALLWPHARPRRLKTPEPMLRAVPDAGRVAALLVDARAAIGPITKSEQQAPPAHAPDLALGAAA